MARGWWGSRHTTTLVVKYKRANEEGPDGLTPSSLLETKMLTRQRRDTHRDSRSEGNTAVLNLNGNYQHEHTWNFIFK